MKRVAVLAVLLLAGCGGAATVTPRKPTLPRALASSLRTQADAVAAALAANDGCLARQRAIALQGSVIAAVNAHRVPPRFQEPLQSAVNDLAARITCTPPAPAPAPPEHGRGHGKHGKHGDQGDQGD
jgi:hypothetical protein